MKRRGRRPRVRKCPCCGAPRAFVEQPALGPFDPVRFKCRSCLAERTGPHPLSGL